MARPVIYIMEDLPNEAFWWGSETRQSAVAAIFRTLVPFRHRSPQYHWGYDRSVHAWRVPISYLNDFLLGVEQLDLDIRVTFVDTLPPPREEVADDECD